MEFYIFAGSQHGAVYMEVVSEDDLQRHNETIAGVLNTAYYTVGGASQTAHVVTSVYSSERFTMSQAMEEFGKLMECITRKGC